MIALAALIQYDLSESSLIISQIHSGLTVFTRMSLWINELLRNYQLETVGVLEMDLNLRQSP